MGKARADLAALEPHARYALTRAMRELRIFYRIGRELAMSAQWPNWNQGDEFRAIRDRSRAGR